MITVDEIRAQAERAYPRFLSSIVTGEAFFPLDVRFGKRFMKGTYHAFAEKRKLLLEGAVRVVEAGELNEEMGHVMSASGGTGGTARRDDLNGVAAIGSSQMARGESSRSQSDSGYVVELGAHASRRFGTQSVPVRIFFEEPAAYASFIGRRREMKAFCEMVDATREGLPDLLPWLGRNSTRVLPYAGKWSDLLGVVRYFLGHPRPNLYARQLPLSVHTKFVEEHESILRLMLEELLPEEAIDYTSSDFAPRFGLRYDEPLVRIRWLDPTLVRRPVGHDVSLPISALAELDTDAETVIISENKMTFLTLPFFEGGLGLWGGGFQVDVLRRAEWLRRRTVFYWGDLDAHGFLILSRLRSFLPEARSLMMNVATFEAFREYAVRGPRLDAESLPNLTPPEQALFHSLARTRLRLEQERITQSHVARQLSALSAMR